MNLGYFLSSTYLPNRGRDFELPEISEKLVYLVMVRNSSLKNLFSNSFSNSLSIYIIFMNIYI